MTKYQQLFPVAIALLPLAGCGQGAVHLTAQQPRATVISATSDLEARIQRVEDGLAILSEDGQILLDEKATLAERMAYYHVPGVSIAVIDDFKIDWVKGYGVLKAGGDEPVTADTLFHAGSVAKPISAAAALALVERGLLNLDENVNDRLISWQIPENEYTTKEKVTLRRLLSHSGGIRDGFTERSANDPVPGYLAPGGVAPSVTLQQLLDDEQSIDVDGPTRVATIPGTEYGYANADYAILELLMVDVTQQPFAVLMREMVLGPMEMTSSTFEQPLPSELRARASTEHETHGQPFDGERLHIPYRAAGGLWTTPSDLARFAIEIMLAYNGQSEKLLSQEMAKEMLTAQIETPDARLMDFSGLGFDLARDGQSLRISLPGGTWGSTCLLWAYPETGQGAVIMTNSASAAGAIRLEVLVSIASEYDWPMMQ